MEAQREALDLQILKPENCQQFMSFLDLKEEHNHSHEHDHGHDHDHDHSHAPKSEKDTCKLITMIILNFIFFVAELVTGFITKSLAMQSDAFHMLSDIAGLIVGLIAHTMTKKSPTPTMTFGWARTEVLGGLANSIFLLAVCMMLTFDAIERFVDPPTIEDPILLLIVGALGLFINIVGMFVFHDHSHSDNMKGVFLHVFGDFLGSIAVIVSACVVTFTEWSLRYYVDPFMSLIIVLILAQGSTKLMLKTAKKVIEACPESVNCLDLESELKKIEGIVSVHELHVWELCRDQNVAMIHIVIDSPESSKRINSEVSNLLISFGVFSSTIQSEFLADFPEGVDKETSCFFSSNVGSQNRAFVTRPVFSHTVGCPHINIPCEHDHDHEHEHDHKHDKKHGSESINAELVDDECNTCHDQL